ncbi:MAG: hypothetical protein AAB635_01045 [Patescibacteria group bacterium]
MMDRMIVRITIAVVLLAGIGGYALYESRNLLRGPIIIIETPVNGATSNTSVTDIKGVAKNIVRISLNDRNISVDESGMFQEKFALFGGRNIIKVSAEDRFGRQTESLVEILYVEPEKPLVANIRAMTVN